jgi:hypothetical protein
VQGDADVVVEGDAVGGVDGVDGAAAGRSRSSRRARWGAAPGPELVQADPADHDDQPAADVVDPSDVGADQPGERLLHGVLASLRLPSMRKGDVEQVTPLIAPRPAQLDIHLASAGGGPAVVPSGALLGPVCRGRGSPALKDV